MYLHNTFVNLVSNFIFKHLSFSEKDKKKIRYGLQGIYLTLVKLVVILLLAALLNVFKYVLLLILFFNIIRFFSFGYHAKNSTICLILSLFFFIVLPITFIKINFSLLFKIVLSLFCFISILLFAPADTSKRKFENKKKILIRKIFSILVAIIYIIISFNTSDVLNKIFLNSLLIESIIINPYFYKVFDSWLNTKVFKHIFRRC